MTHPTTIAHRFLLLAAFACCGLATQPVHASAQVLEVPFDLVHGTVILQVSVNGHGPLSMMLDSGADPSIVDLKAARNLGLALASKGEAGSGGGADVNLSYETTLPLLEISGLKAMHVAALGMGLSKISSALGRPVQGVLGYSLFKSRIVQIDYPRHLVRFYATAPACASASRCTVLPFRYHDDVLMSGVTVDGKSVTTNVDTGSDSVFQINPASVDKLGLRGDVATGTVSTSTGFNGALTNREGSVRNITLGHISVNAPLVVFVGKGMGVDTEPWDLRMGSGFLMNYVVTLDFRHMQITLAAPRS